MRLWEILVEAVGGQYLYHGVPDGRTLMQILKSGSIQPQEPFDFDQDMERTRRGDPDYTPPNRISLTRNQYLHFPYGHGVAQIVVDKNALRQRGYKIQPVVGAMIPHKYETEEQVYKPIPMAAPFVVEIQYDPNLKIPKSFFTRVQQQGIKVTPWRQEGRSPLAQPQVKAPQRQNTYTDPNKIKVSGNGYTYGIPPVKVPADEWYITYPNNDEYKTSEIIGPRSKDKKYVMDLAKKIKQRVAQKLTFDDLLPARQFGKTWQKGYYEIFPKDPEWKD